MAKQYVMIHHSLTKDNTTVSWGAIERYHRRVNVWSDIGYHYGVELCGDDYYALLGRSDDLDAAACRESAMNSRAVHVCCVGNFDLAPPPEKLLDVLVKRVLVPVCKKYGIPTSQIVGHRDYATYKTCPGAQFDLEALRRHVELARWRR